MKSLRPVLILYAFPAILLALLPATHEVLLYDRDAILHGQLWRLWTGHWVHFSTSHLLWNLLGLLLLGSRLETVQPGLLRRFTLLSAPILSSLLLITEPAMAIYGGLSGLLTGIATLLGLTLIRHGDCHRAIGWALLTLLVGKLAYDLRHEALLVSFDQQTIQPSLTVHLLGATLALGAWLISEPRSGNRLAHNNPEEICS